MIFETVASSIRNVVAFKIYEGLPHDVWETELYKQELQNATTIRIVGSPFYAEPVVVSNEVATRLLNLISNRSSFVPFSGFKSCGGFHSDWCVVWQEADRAYSANICFGCGELMVFQDDERILYCNIWDDEQFKELLAPLRTNRPPEKEG